MPLLRARLPSSFSTCRDSIESALLLCDAQHDEHNNNDESIDAIFLGGNHIGDKGVARIIDGLEDYIQYRKLYLCDNRISKYGVHLISQSLKHNTTLIELSLADNSIGDTGASLLAASLQENNTLEILNLENNGIGCEGTKSIVGALLHNTVLRCLMLSENPIGDDGAKAILRCLRDTSSLHNLYNSNHTIVSIILKKPHIKSSKILRDIKSYLRVNRMASNIPQLAARRKLLLCVREDPTILTKCFVTIRERDPDIGLAMMPRILWLLASQLDLATVNVILKLILDQIVM
jgi:hypothetical protein